MPLFMFYILCTFVYMRHRSSRGALKYGRSASRTLSMVDCERSRCAKHVLHTYLLYSVCICDMHLKPTNIMYLYPTHI